MRPHKLGICASLALMLALLCAYGAAADTTVGMTGAGTFRMEQVYVNVPELDVYFYALDGDGNPYSSIKVQAAGPELTLGNRRLEVRSVAVASDPICYILALDNSKSIAPSEFYTMLGGVRKLINAMGDDDQLMLYTTAGSTECVLPATSDKNLMYKTLGSIKQVEGSMDTARLISAVYSELQSDYQALAPRKAAMIVTDAGQVLTNMALFATLASDVGDQIGMAAYIYLMTDRPGVFETLESAADGRLVLCEASTLGDELKKKQEYFATALEIKTEVPEIVDVRGLHIRNSTPGSGTFVSSNDLLNKTQRLIGWGIKSNMVSYLTDCPHREKLPWLEQLHLMFGSLQYTFDMFSLYEKMLAEQQAAEGAERVAQIGSGDRSEKIRTYNGPQDRVTDHRIGFNSTYNGVLLGDQLGTVIEALAAAERAEKLAQAV